MGFVVGYQAVSRRSTWILIKTGVNTVLVPTGLVLRALSVLSTANDFTGNKWISFVAGYTLAVGLVSSWIAFSKPATRIVDQAGVHTFPVDTGLSVPAVIVRLAAYRLAGDEWVANVSWRTGADGSVVLNEALSVGATVTRVHTLAVDAGFAVGAVIISSTARRVG